MLWRRIRSLRNEELGCKVAKNEHSHQGQKGVDISLRLELLSASLRRFMVLFFNAQGLPGHFTLQHVAGIQSRQGAFQDHNAPQRQKGFAMKTDRVCLKVEQAIVVICCLFFLPITSPHALTIYDSN